MKTNNLQRISKGIKSFITLISLILGVSSSVITILDKYFSNNIYSKKSDVFSSYKSIEFILDYKGWFIIVSFGIAGYLLITQYLKRKGERKIPIKFKVFLSKINPFTLYKLIELIHEFQHEIDRVEISLISDDNSTGRNDKVKELVARLLVHAQKIIQTATGSYVSVHVKVFESQQNRGVDDISPVEINNVYLKTYERVPSLFELKRTKDGKIEPRKNTELFLVSNSYPAHVEDAISFDVKAKKKKSSSVFKVNSAYNYVLGANEHYWTSNNLIIDLKKKNFFCTSNNYNLYYNSLAVFPIAPPVIVNEDLEADIPIGLFIIDSFEYGVFDKYFIGQIAGYISHRLFDIFLLLE